MSLSLQRSNGVSNLNASGDSKPKATLGSRTGGLLGKKNQTKPPPPKPENPLVSRINRLKDAYDKTSVNCRFKAIVYNAKGSGGTGTLGSGGNKKPPTLTDEEWETAMAQCVDQNKYVPDVLVGFDAISERIDSQHQIIEKMQAKLDDLKKRIDSQNEQFDYLLYEKIKQIIERNNEIHDTLMSVLEVEEVNALASLQISREEQNLLNQIERMDDGVSSFGAQLNNLKLNAKLMSASVSVPLPISIDSESISTAESVLKVNNKALEELIKYTKKVEKSADAIEKALDEDQTSILQSTK